MFDGGLLVLVQVHLDQLGAIQLDADALANDLGGEDQILKDGVVDGRQGAGARALLLQGIAGLARRLGQDLALTNHDDVLSRELLLQLANQDDLDLLEHLLLWNGHVDDDGLRGRRETNGLISTHQPAIQTYLLAAELDLARTGDVQVAEVRLQVAVGLEFHQGLGDGLLEIIGIRAAGLDNLGADSHLQGHHRKSVGRQTKLNPKTASAQRSHRTQIAGNRPSPASISPGQLENHNYESLL